MLECLISSSCIRVRKWEPNPLGNLSCCLEARGSFSGTGKMQGWVRENQQARKHTSLETCVFCLGSAFPDVDRRIRVCCFSTMQLVWLCMHQWCLHTQNGWAQLPVCIQEALQVLCRCTVCWWIFNLERKYWESVWVVLFSCYNSAWDSLHCWNYLLASCLAKICATDSHSSF